MKPRTFVGPNAQTDVRDAALWYESREPGLGLRFIGEVRTSLQHIRSNPLRFPSVDEPIRRALLKSFPYSVYFLNDDNVITVVAVLHQHRHSEAWKSRRS
jgi:plasmid stabilization system protein ParE